MQWLWRWGPALAWMGVIFGLSAQSHPPFVPGGDGLPYVLRKLGHFTEFGILALLLRHACAPQASWLAFVLSAAYAASDEWHQSFVPGREMLWTDWVIDAAGAAVALWFVPHATQIARRKINNRMRGGHDARRI